LSEEKLPLSDVYKVESYKTIFRSERWWEAVVLTEAFGKKSINLYLWIKKGDQWKRKHKFVVRSLEEWNKIREPVESLLQKVSSTTGAKKF